MSTPMALAPVLDGHEWTTAGLALIVRNVREHREFTSDDLRAELPEPPHPNKVGSLIAAALHQGLIEEKARRRSTRRTRHGSRLTVWGAPEQLVALDMRAVA